MKILRKRTALRRRPMSGLILSCILVLVAMAWILPATAEDAKTPFPKSGNYAVQVISTGYYPITSLGDQIEASLIRYTATLNNPEGAGFLHNAKGECFGIVLYERELDRQTGLCRYTDGDGDLFYEQFEHDGENGSGRGHSLGGTGKYEGVTSAHQYQFPPIDPDAEEEFESVATRTGTFSFE